MDSSCSFVLCISSFSLAGITQNIPDIPQVPSFCALRLAEFFASTPHSATSLEKVSCFTIFLAL
jgi:hypothetical protein